MKTIKENTFSYCNFLNNVTFENSAVDIGEYAFYYCSELKGIDFGNSVKSIGYSAFSMTGLQNISLPSSVISIGKYAFDYCEMLANVKFNNCAVDIANDAFYNCVRLTNVDFGNSVKSIGSYSFSNTGLTSVNLPSSVTTIGYSAFSYCRGLVSVKFDNCTVEIESSVFSGCTRLTDVDFGTNIKSIGSSVFYNTGLLAVDIPDSVVSIGTSAFANCDLLESVYIGSGIESIGASSFDNCPKLKSIEVDSKCLNYSSIDGVLLSADKTTLIKYPVGHSLISYTVPDGVTAIAANAFCESKNLTSVILPDSLKTIGSSAFYGCELLSGIIIPISITNIGNGAFTNCSKLNSVKFNDCEADIGSSAFSGCTNLASIDFGSGVKTIGSSAFLNCSSLTSVKLPASLTSIASGAATTGVFVGCSRLASIKFDNCAANVGNYTFYGCTNLTSVDFGDSLIAIGSYAFYNTRPTTVHVPASVTTIGTFAFANCALLTTVYIGGNKTIIEANAFHNCPRLERIIFPPDIEDTYVDENGVMYTADKKTLKKYPPALLLTTYEILDGVTAIDANAFYGCNKLTGVVLPDTLKAIGSSSFYGCSSLRSITIPLNVTNIGSNAFQGCTGLMNLTFDNCAADIGGSAFSGCYSLANIDFGSEVKSIGSSAFYNCTALTKVTFPSSLTSILGGSSTTGAFYNCSRLESVVFDNSKASIGSYVFYGRTSLTNVDFGDNIISIGSYAFYNTRSVMIDIPTSVSSIGTYAFANCSLLKSVNIGAGTTSIGLYAFNNCQNLEIIEADDANPNYTSIDGILFGGDKTTLIKYPEGILQTSYTVPDKVTAIEINAFYGSRNLTSVFLPETLKTIGSSAFSGCLSLIDIVIPSSVTSIGSDVFYNCPALKSIEVDEVNPSYKSVDGVLMTANGARLIKYPEGLTLTSHTVPDGVTAIENNAFRNSRYLTNVILPNTLTSIGNYAFSGCTILADIVIPANVSNMGSYCFQNCTGLVSVELSNCAASIGSFAFSECTKLANIDLGNALRTISSNAFYLCSSLVNVKFPSSLTGIYAGSNTTTGAFYGCSALKSVVFESSTVSIGSYTFYNCSGLESVVFENSAASIESYAFYGCTRLKSVEFDRRIRSIGMYTFANCILLEGITIPSSVTSIGTYAFYGCTGLTSVDIMANVLTIGDYAFASCRNLTRIEIPRSVNSIGNNAFSSSNNVTVYTWTGAYAETFAKARSIPVIIYLLEPTSIEVSLPPGEYENMKLTLTNKTTSIQYNETVTDELRYSFEGLTVDNIYKLTLTNRFGFVIGEIDNIEAKEGVNIVTFAELLIIKTIAIKVLDDNGEDVTSKATIRWYNESGDYLATESNLSDVIVGTTLLYKIELDDDLGSRFSTPAITTYVVVEDNNIEVILAPIPILTISGIVVNAQTDTPLPDSTIVITQILDDKYTHNVTVTTGGGGIFTAQVFDVESTIMVSCENYINKTITQSGFKENEDLGTIRLSPISGAVILLDMSYICSAVPGETPIKSPVLFDYLSLHFELYSQTQGKEITNFIYQHPYLILPDGVDENDVVEISVSSQENDFSPTQTDIIIDNDFKATASLDLVQLGSFEANISSSDNKENTAMIFNKSGDFVKTYRFKDKYLQSEIMMDGEYDIIFLGYSEILRRISHIDKLDDIGLTAGTDYAVKKDVSIKSGIISVLSDIHIPNFDETRFFYADSRNISYTANKNPAMIGTVVTMRAEYEISNDYYTSDHRVLFDIPDGFRLLENSVSFNGIIIPYTKNGNTVAAYTNRASGIIYFAVVPDLVGSFALGAFLSFVYEGSSITQPIDTAVLNVLAIDMTLPGTINTLHTIVRGVAIPESEVIVYDNGIAVATTESNAAGTWFTEYDRVEDSDFSVHEVYAEVVTDKGVKIKTDTKRMIYSYAYPSISKVSMYHAGQKIDFDLFNQPEITPSYSFQPLSPSFTFVAEAMKNKYYEFEDVCFVTKDSNGETTVIPARLDQNIDKWVAVHVYSDANLPTSVGLEYNPIFIGDFFEMDEEYSEGHLSEYSVPSPMSASPTAFNFLQEFYEKIDRLSRSSIVKKTEMVTDQLLRAERYLNSALDKTVYLSAESLKSLNTPSTAKSLDDIFNHNSDIRKVYFTLIDCILADFPGLSNDYRAIAVRHLREALRLMDPQFYFSIIAPVRPTIDPAGYVYEAVASNRLFEAKTTAYFKEVDDGNDETAILWNAAEYDQANPLFTNIYGMYAWDVPFGFWQVKCEKAGYETVYSKWLPVPPPQMDVNLGLISYAAPNITQVNGYESAIEIAFDKYMKIPSLTTDNIIISQNGTAISGSIETQNAEVNPKNTGEQFASIIRFIPEESFPVGTNVELTVKQSVKSYADVAMNNDFSKDIEIGIEPQSISTFEDVVHMTYGENKELVAFVLPKEAAAGMKIKAVSDSPEIMSVENEAIIDSEGTAYILVDSLLPGVAELTLSLEGTSLQTKITVNAVIPSNLPKLDKPTASIPSGATVDKNTTVELISDSEGASIYYTTDGLEPQFSESALLYTNPIEITDDMVILAVASEEEMADSDIAVFIYQLELPEEKLNKPTASIPSGTTVAKNTKVALFSDTEDASIYYTTDGTSPDISETKLLYISPIEILENITIFALARKEGMVDSDVAEFIYSIETAVYRSGGSSSTSSGEKSFDIDSVWFDSTGKTQTLTFNGFNLTISDAMFQSIELGQGKVTFAIKTASSVAISITQGGKEILWYNNRQPMILSIPFNTGDEYTVIYNKLTDKPIPRSWYNDGNAYAKIYQTGTYEAKQIEAEDFDDTAGYWMDTATRYMVARNVISGIGNNLFAPNRNVTRAEFVSMLMRAINIQPQDELTTQQFDDVEEGAFYYNILLTAKELKIVKGIGNNKFAPEEAISRQDMFLMLYNAIIECNILLSPENNMELNHFSDHNLISEYANIAMIEFVQNGIVKGYGDGRLNPKGTATRGESAQVIYNVLKRDADEFATDKSKVKSQETDKTESANLVSTDMKAFAADTEVIVLPEKSSSQSILTKSLGAMEAPVIPLFATQSYLLGEKYKSNTEGISEQLNSLALLNVAATSTTFSAVEENNLYNLSFEEGNFDNWRLLGRDCHVIRELNDLKPTNGYEYMAFLRTGVNAISQKMSSISRTFTYSAANSELHMDYNFISNEQMRSVNSKFNDTLTIKIHNNSVEKLVCRETVNTNAYKWKSLGSDYLQDSILGLMSYHTGWRPLAIDLRNMGLKDGNTYVLEIYITDIEDTLYDSAVLVSNLSFAEAKYFDLKPNSVNFGNYSGYMDVWVFTNMNSSEWSISKVASSSSGMANWLSSEVKSYYAKETETYLYRIWIHADQYSSNHPTANPRTAYFLVSFTDGNRPQQRIYVSQFITKKNLYGAAKPYMEVTTHVTNCYNYALGLVKDSDPTYEPGYYYYLENKDSEEKKEINYADIDDVAKRVVKDMEAYGGDGYILKGLDEPLKDNSYRRIALRLCYWEMRDYHFLVQHSDGSWSDKFVGEPSHPFEGDTPETDNWHGKYTGAIKYIAIKDPPKTQ